MNYQKIYDDFIADRRKKEPSIASGIYTEKHHILPRSLNGSNDNTNLIALTFEDHVRAHVLLARIHGGKMWAPVLRMVTCANFSGRLITKPMLRALSQYRKNWSKVSGDLVKAANANDPTIKLRKKSASTQMWADPQKRANITATMIAVQNLPEQKQKRSDRMIAFYSEQSNRDDQRERMIERFKSDEVRKAYSEKARKVHARPGFKERHKEATAAALTPEVCKARGIALSQSILSDPAKRAAKAEAARIGNAKRKKAADYFGVNYKMVTKEMLASLPQTAS